MTSELDTYAPPENEQSERYKALSTAAVTSLVVGVVSLLGILFAPLLAVGVMAACLAILALIRIRRYPDELAGRWCARLGLLLGIASLVAGSAWHSYVYMTEVPEGYARISFADLQPDDDQDVSLVSRKALELNGQKVFIKGYVHPGVSGQGAIREFVLVRDMGTCCFGGQPKLTDMIEVTLSDSLRARYSTRRRKLGGVLRVTDQRKSIGGIQGGFYKLEADHLR